jgi:hypothetical protein
MTHIDKAPNPREEMEKEVTRIILRAKEYVHAYTSEEVLADIMTAYDQSVAELIEGIEKKIEALCVVNTEGRWKYWDWASDGQPKFWPEENVRAILKAYLPQRSNDAQV